MNTISFNGVYGADIMDNKHSMEYFYQKITRKLPNYYQLKIVNIKDVLIQFKMQFSSWIEDYLIMDCAKMANGLMNYKLCYVLKNNIFVIIDEANQSVKVMYHQTKDDYLKTVVSFFAALP